MTNKFALLKVAFKFERCLVETTLELMQIIAKTANPPYSKSKIKPGR